MSADVAVLQDEKLPNELHGSGTFADASIALHKVHVIMLT